MRSPVVVRKLGHVDVRGEKSRRKQGGRLGGRSSADSRTVIRLLPVMNAIDISADRENKYERIVKGTFRQDRLSPTSE